MHRIIKSYLLLIIALYISNSDCTIAFRWKKDLFATHQPVLYEIAMNTTGAIIEFGCGYGSTDMLHEICKATKRTLISLDDDLEWLEKFSKKYKDDSWHQFYYISGKKGGDDPSHWINFLNESDIFKTMVFDICFIDQSPWLGRYETLKALKFRSKYIIIHDVDYFPGSNLFGTVIRPIDVNTSTPGEFDFSDTFEHYKVYFPPKPWPGKTGPPTLVGSQYTALLPEIDWSKYID